MYSLPRTATAPFCPSAVEGSVPVDPRASFLQKFLLAVGFVALFVGSFVIGFFGTLTPPDGPRPASLDTRLFVMVGLCGGFTTFSSFSLQTFELLRSGESIRAASYIVASVLLCVVFTALGHYLAGGIGSRA